MKMRMKMQIKFRLLFIALMFVALVGCSTSVVPPGTTVIKLSSNGDVTIYTEGSYNAYGRDRIYFVDTKLKSFTESMKILCKDKVNMTVDVKWIGSFDVSKEKMQIIKDKVPAIKVNTGDISSYQLSLEEFYNIAMRDIVRNNSRINISPYVTDAIPENRKEIEATIRKAVIDKLIKLGYPVVTSDVMLSNLDFDEKITETRKAIKSAELEDQRKAALAKAILAQAKRDEEIAVEQGKATIVRAQVQAKENSIISKSITPEILAMKQWEVLGEAAKGPNNEIFVIPYEALRSSDLTGIVINKSALNKYKK